MANESFAEFADTLQKEIEDETGIKFGILQLDLFSGLTYTETEVVENPLSEEQAKLVLASVVSDQASLPEGVSLPQELEAVREQAAAIVKVHGEITPSALTSLTYTTEVQREKSVTYDGAQALMAHFEQKGYITKSGKIKDSMKAALQSGTLELPQQFESARPQLEQAIRRANTKPPVWDDSRNVPVTLKKEVMLSPEFLELWNKIKQKTVYRVQIDESELVRRCVEELKAMESIPKARIMTQTANIQIDHPGVTYVERGVRAMDIQESYAFLPNVLAIIGEQTLVKRTTVYKILKQSGRAQDFLNNPQMFIEQATAIILNVRRSLAVDGISYRKLHGAEYYAQEIFDGAELIANLDRNAVPEDHSVYDYIMCDSTVENRFAAALDDDPDVKMFFKLPSRFKVDIPIGNYNPDWAVYVETDGVKKLYFVIETKGSDDPSDQRPHEDQKIRCGTAGRGWSSRTRRMTPWGRSRCAVWTAPCRSSSGLPAGWRPWTCWPDGWRGWSRRS